MESGHEGVSVLFATRRCDGMPVVVKVRHKSAWFMKAHEECEWRRTMEAQLNMPQSKNICDLLEVIETSECYYVVMEWIEGQDLLDAAVEQDGLSHGVVREVMRQILEALAFMHGVGRLHRDLKLENVMLEQAVRHGSDSSECSSPRTHTTASLPATTPSSADSTCSTWSAKLIDFDTAEDWDPGCCARARAVVGTDGYIAPEAYRGCYSPASDLYSAGVVMYMLLTGGSPFRQDTFARQPGENVVGTPSMERTYHRLKSHKIDFARSQLGSCEEAASLCRLLLAFHPGKRPSAASALRHEWFELPLDCLPP